MTRIAVLCLCALFAFSVAAPAQTVSVDALGVADDVTIFNTISEAIISFESVSREALTSAALSTYVSDELAKGPLPPTPGPNGGNVAANVINVVGFGPYDEVVPWVGTSIFRGVDLGSPENTITINGDLSGTLWLTRDMGHSGAAVGSSGSTSLVINDMIIAPSATDDPGDDFFFPISQGEVILTDCIVTAFSASDQTTAVSVAGLPAGLLDGTAGIDGTLVQEQDNGPFVGLFGSLGDTSHLELNNTVWTQRGLFPSTTGDPFIISGDATVDINAGSVFSAGGRFGVQHVSGTAGAGITTVNMQGTRDNRVLWLNHGDFAESAVASDILPFDPSITNIDEVTFVNGEAAAYYVIDTDAGSVLNMTNTIIASYEVDGLNFDNTGGKTFDGLANITIADCGNACVAIGLSPPAASAEFTDCVFAGPGPTAIETNNAADSVTLTNCAVALGAAVQDGLANGNPADLFTGPGTVTQVNVIFDLPDFATTAFSLANAQDITNNGYYDTRNLAYATAASGGTPLGGGADYVGGGVPVELSVFSAD
jgi:hypothetical protein